VLVSSYQLSTAADGTPTEEVTLRYDASHLHYQQQNANGAPGATFDFAESDLGVEEFAPAQRSVLQSGPVLAPAGYHMLLQVDGVQGESADAKHPGAIEVLAFEWGGDASGGSPTGGGAGTGRTRFSELHVVSRINKATPTLLAKMASGVHVAGGVLTLVRNTTGAEFLRISLTDVQVSSYQVTTAPTGGWPKSSRSLRPRRCAGHARRRRRRALPGQRPPTVTLDGSGTADADRTRRRSPTRGNLDGDGLFGETGADAARGDEVGIHPVFSAAGLYGPQTLDVTLKVTDATGKSDTDVTTVTIVDVTPPETVITSGPPALTNQTSATISFTGTDQGTPADQLKFTAEIDGGPRVAVTSPLVLSGPVGRRAHGEGVRRRPGRQRGTHAGQRLVEGGHGRPGGAEPGGQPVAGLDDPVVKLSATISDVAAGNSKRRVGPVQPRRNHLAADGRGRRRVQQSQ